MAIVKSHPAPSYELHQFLEAWGIDVKKMTSCTIKIALDDIVRVKVEYLWEGDTEELNKVMSKEYGLVELKNE